MKPPASVEEYPPGLGTPNTLDGYRTWCARRDEAERGVKERRRLATIERDAAAKAAK